jgi:hypothetical protein
MRKLFRTEISFEADNIWIEAEPVAAKGDHRHQPKRRRGHKTRLDKERII